MTNQAELDLSGALEDLRIMLNPCGPRQDFLVRQLAVLSVQYHLLLSAELALPESEFRVSRGRLCPTFINSIRKRADLRKLRKEIHAEFTRVLYRLNRMQARETLNNRSRKPAAIHEQ